MFTSFQNGNTIVIIPLELLPSLVKIIQDETILTDVKRNTDWIKITARPFSYFRGAGI